MDRGLGSEARDQTRSASLNTLESCFVLRMDLKFFFLYISIYILGYRSLCCVVLQYPHLVVYWWPLNDVIQNGTSISSRKRLTCEFRAILGLFFGNRWFLLVVSFVVRCLVWDWEIQYRRRGFMWIFLVGLRLFDIKVILF